MRWLVFRVRNLLARAGPQCQSVQAEDKPEHQRTPLVPLLRRTTTTDQSTLIINTKRAYIHRSISRLTLLKNTRTFDIKHDNTEASVFKDCFSFYMGSFSSSQAFYFRRMFSVNILLDSIVPRSQFYIKLHSSKVWQNLGCFALPHLQDYAGYSLLLFATLASTQHDAHSGFDVFTSRYHIHVGPYLSFASLLTTLLYQSSRNAAIS